MSSSAPIKPKANMVNKTNVINDGDVLEEYFYPDVEITIPNGFVDIPVTKPKQWQRQPIASPKRKIRTRAHVEGRVIGTGRNRVVVRKQTISPLAIALKNNMADKGIIRMYQLDPKVYPEAYFARQSYLNRQIRKAELQSIAKELKALRKRHEDLKNENKLLNIQLKKKEAGLVNGVGCWLAFFRQAGILPGLDLKYAIIFEMNNMCRDTLDYLTEDHLRQMGITPFGDIFSILKHASMFGKRNQESALKVAADFENFKENRNQDMGNQNGNNHGRRMTIPRPLTDLIDN